MMGRRALPGDAVRGMFSLNEMTVSIRSCIVLTLHLPAPMICYSAMLLAVGFTAGLLATNTS